MALSYLKLWHKLLDAGLTKTRLRDAAGISSGTLAKLSKGEEVTVGTLSRICEVLKCDIGDIMSYVPDADDVKEIGSAR